MLEIDIGIIHKALETKVLPQPQGLGQPFQLPLSVALTEDH
jgi:hypothetical protein